ncbi:MAG: glycosyltransferase [Planctomycetota bacterium]
MSIDRLLFCTFAYPTPRTPDLMRQHRVLAHALRDRGVEVTVVKPLTLGRGGGVPIRAVEDGVECVCPRLPFPFTSFVKFRLQPQRPGLVANWFALAGGRALRREIDRVRPDAILAHPALPWGLAMPTILKERRVPFAVLDQAAPAVMGIEPGSALQDAYRRVGASAERLFCVGPQMVERLSSLGIDNAAFLPNAIRLPDPELLRRPRPADLEGKFIVLSLAYYYRRKGFEELVEAFTTAAQGHPDAVLVLGTQPPPALAERLAPLEREGRARVLGRVPFDEVLPWMAWADVFAMPSWDEGYGNVYGEALACGTPVILCDDAGFAPLIDRFDASAESPGTGWVVRPKSVPDLVDALGQGLRHRDMLTAMGAAGQELVGSRLTAASQATTVIDAFQTAR